MTFDVQTSHRKPFLDQHSAETEEEKTAAPAEALLHQNHRLPQHQEQEPAQLKLQVPQVRHVQGRTQWIILHFNINKVCVQTRPSLVNICQRK